MSILPISAFSMGALELKKRFPPQFIMQNKQILYLLTETTVKPTGKVGFSRWSPMDLPNSSPDHELTNMYKEDLYLYTHTRIPEVKVTDIKEYYLNFADRHLFMYYGTQLFAQDEIQVSI